MTIKQLLDSYANPVPKTANITQYRGRIGWVGPRGEVITPRRSGEAWHHDLVRYIDEPPEVKHDLLKHGWIKFYKQDDEALFFTQSELTSLSIRKVFQVAEDLREFYNVSKYSFQSNDIYVEANELIAFRQKLRAESGQQIDNKLIETEFPVNKYRGTLGWIGPDGTVIFRQKSSEYYHHELVKYFNTDDKQALINPMAHGWVKFYKQNDTLLFQTFSKLDETLISSIFLVAKEFADSFDVVNFDFESPQVKASGNSLIDFRRKMLQANQLSEL